MRARNCETLGRLSCLGVKATKQAAGSRGTRGVVCGCSAGTAGPSCQQTCSYSIDARQTVQPELKASISKDWPTTTEGIVNNAFRSIIFLQDPQFQDPGCFSRTSPPRKRLTVSVVSAPQGGQRQKPSQLGDGSAQSPPPLQHINIRIEHTDPKLRSAPYPPHQLNLQFSAPPRLVSARYLT